MVLRLEIFMDRRYLAISGAKQEAEIQQQAVKSYYQIADCVRVLYSGIIPAFHEESFHEKARSRGIRGVLCKLHFKSSRDRYPQRARSTAAADAAPIRWAKRTRRKLPVRCGKMDGKGSPRTHHGYRAHFAYRALRIGRGDMTPLPGFEQDDFVRNGGFAARTLADLAEEFGSVRSASIALFRSFDEEALSRRGVASEKEVTVRALGFITAGHQIHHRMILEERYFPAIPRA